MYFLDAATFPVCLDAWGDNYLRFLAGRSFETALPFAYSFWLIGTERSFLKAIAARPFYRCRRYTAVEDVFHESLQLKGLNPRASWLPKNLMSFEATSFPIWHSALIDLGDDVIPRILEVVFPQRTLFR